MKSLKQQGVTAFIWEFTSRILSRGMRFIISIFLARLLEPEDFGLIALVMIVIELASLFTNIGLNGALIQRKRNSPIHYSSVFYFSLTVGILLTMSTFIAAPYFADFYQKDILEPLMKVLSFSFIINALCSVQVGIFRKNLEYAILTKIRFLSTGIPGIIGILLAYSGFGVWSLAASSILSSFLFTLFIWLKSQWRPSFIFSFKALKNLWGFGFRMFLSGLLDNVYLRLDYMIIGKLFPIETVGYLQRAKSLNELATQYSAGSLMSVLFPLLSKIKGDLNRFQKIVEKSFNLISFMAFLLLGILYLSSESIIVLIFGEKWLPSVEYFKIIALIGFNLPVSSVLVNILSSRGKSKDFLRLEIYKKIVMSTDFIILIYYGVIMYLYYKVLTSIITIYINIIFAAREIQVDKRTFIIPLINQGLIALSAVIFIQYFNTMFELGYFSMLFLQTAEYIFIFIVLNIIFKTKQMKTLWKEIEPTLNQKYKKWSAR